MPALLIDHERLAEVCRKWRIAELSLFGSALRDDFGPDSDVDLLVRFADDSPVSLWNWAELEQDFSGLFAGRRVDIVSKSSIERSENPYRRPAILNSARVVYAA